MYSERIRVAPPIIGDDHGREDHVEAKEVGGVQRRARILVELVEDPHLGPVCLDHLDRRERLLDARGEIAVGKAIGQRAAPDSRRAGDDHPADGNPDEQHDQREPRIEGGNDHDTDSETVERVRGTDDRTLNQVDDHGAVLVDAEDRVANPAVAVIPERQRLGAFDHRDTEVLVDALPDPGAVVPQRRAEDRAENARDHGPDHQSIAHGAALVACQFRFDRFGIGAIVANRCRAQGTLGGRTLALRTLRLAKLVRVGRDVLLADEQHGSLDRLQLVADERLVVEQIRPHERADERR